MDKLGSQKEREKEEARERLTDRETDGKSERGYKKEEQGEVN